MDEENVQPRLTIGQRINEIRKNIAYIQKDVKAEQGQKGVSHDKVTAMVRPYMINFGVITIVNEIKSDFRPTGKMSKSGTPSTIFLATYEVRFACDDNIDEYIPVTVTGMGEDFGDKGPGKATSYAVKTAMLKMFNIETGVDDESRLETVAEPIKPETIKKITDSMENAEVLGMNREKTIQYLKDFYNADSVSKLSEIEGEQVYESIEMWIKNHEPK